MITFKQRQSRAIKITVVLLVAIIAFMLAYDYSLHSSRFISGWLLLSLVLSLASYNLRKKLTYPPLFKSSSWLQFHIYTGCLSVVIFFFHSGFKLPKGPLDVMMYVIFLLLALSGLCGLFLSRSIPRRLADRGSEVLYERIPIYRRQLCEQAQTLVIESVAQNNGEILSDFYHQLLADFMATPQNVWLHLIHRDRSCKALQHKLKAMYRYLNKDEANTANQLSQLINRKDDLDFHYSLQRILKIWLFVHIPLTFVLIMIGAVHLVLVYAFSGAVL